MGLFNVFKLANDYAKAKAFVEERKADIEKGKVLVERIKGFIEELTAKKASLIKLIDEGKELVKQIEGIVRKGGNV